MPKPSQSAAAAPLGPSKVRAPSTKTIPAPWDKKPQTVSNSGRKRVPDPASPGSPLAVDPLDEVPGIEALSGGDPHLIVGPSQQVYRGRSLCCFRPAYLPRRLCIYILEWNWFEPIILTTIICNCLTMAWQSPLDPVGTAKSAFVHDLECIYLAVFTAEMLLKMMAYGVLFQTGAYLLDPWCQLDFVVVALAWMPILIPTFGQYTALRALRALRPLRALKRVPGMPALVQSILAALPRVGNVLLLCGFISLVFAIVGVEMFKGSLHYRCALDGFVETVGHPHSKIVDEGLTLLADHRAIRALLQDRRLQEQADFDTEISCNPLIIDSSLCPDGSSCQYFDQTPSNGLMSFDSVASALVWLLQALTFDDWTVAMYSLMHEISPYVVIYFLLMVVIGGFFVSNLFLAVIFEEFIAAQAKESNSSTAASGTATDEAAGNSDQESLLGSGAEQARSAEHISSHRWCLPPREQGWRKVMAGIATSEWFNYSSAAIVVINMVLMCTTYQGMDSGWSERLESAQNAITWIFIAEMTFKLIGLGCVGYWSDNWNAVDGSIVLLSIFGMLLTAAFSGSTFVNVSFLRILRMVRVMRVLRLMRSWKGLYEVVTTFTKAVKQMSNLFILMVIFMVIFALLATQLFGGSFNPSTGFSHVPCPGGLCPDSELAPKPRFHFDYFMPSMLTVFILMTGEWIDAMEPATAASGPLASLFFIGVILVGRYLIMNLLVAIVLSAFGEDSSEEPTDQSEDQAAASHSADEGVLSSGSKDSNPTREAFREASRRTPIVTAPREAGPNVWKQDELDLKTVTDELTLCCLGPKNVVRRMCIYMTNHPLFDPLIIIAILVSSVCLALDSPRLDSNSALKRALESMDQNLWPWLFLAELMIKVVASGLFFTRNAYLKSSWNQLDFVIVCASLLALAATRIPELATLTNVRVLRVLRPLRIVSRNEGMKIILSSLFKAMPSVSNVVAVVLAVQAVFAILGMQLFMGSMGACTNPNMITKSECVEPADASAARHLAGINGRSLKGGGSSSVWDGTGAVEWLNPRVGSFDNFGTSMLLLYVMSTGDEWEKYMFRMMDSTGIGTAPVRNDFSPACIYSIVWMFIGSFFAMNLFVGVIVDEFHRIKKETDGSATMTKQQQQWVQTMKAMAMERPARAARVPSNCMRRMLYDLVTSQQFDAFIMMVIVLIVGVMACDYWGIEQNEQHQMLFSQATRYSAYFFYSEFALKVVALGLDGYFADRWNRFDFFLVSTTLLDQFASEWLAAILPVNPMLLRVLRVLRILRILRLLKGAKDLRDLILTMIYSFPSLINVCGVLLLLTFMYAVLGVDLFTYVVHQDNIDASRNFESLSNAGLLLFQCLTNDAWSGIMADAMASEERGECSAAAGDCGSWVAIPYFISYQIFGSFVFLNLIVAIILENFSSLGSQSADLAQAADVERFREVWCEFDPDADNYMLARDLPHLCLRLPPPIGLKGVAGKDKAVRICAGLRVKVNSGGLVAFYDVLNALLKYNYKRCGHNVDDDAFRAVVKSEMPAVPESPPPPAVPSRSALTQELTAAEKLADDMPDADTGQRFALVIIAKYLNNIKRWKKRAAGGDASKKRAAARLAKARAMTSNRSKVAATGSTARAMQSPPKPLQVASGKSAVLDEPAAILNSTNRKRGVPSSTMV